MEDKINIPGWEFVPRSQYVNVKEQQILDNMKFCCPFLNARITLRSFMRDGAYIVYYPNWRAYTLFTLDNSDSIGLYCCPFCGKKFPQSLRDEWHDMLEQEYPDYPNIPLPEEFKTDEWWKKRGFDDPKVLKAWQKEYKKWEKSNNKTSK